MNIVRITRVSLRLALAAIVLATSLLMAAVPPLQVSAADCPKGTQSQSNGTCICPAGYQLVTQSVDAADTHCIPINKNSANLNDNPIYFYLKNFMRFASFGMGFAVVGGIVAGGYMYMTARANAGQVEKAKTVIINSIVGLLLYIFMFAILQFLIPGGIFS